MSDFLKALDDEVAALEADIASNPDPRLKKLDQLRSVRDLYGSGTRPDRPLQPVTPAPTEQERLLPSRGTMGVRRKVDPSRIKVLKAAEDVVAFHGGPIKTSDVYDRMNPEVRALIGGTEPRSNLSAMMHHSPRFTSHGRSGWTLAENSGVRGLADKPPSEITLEELMG